MKISQLMYKPIADVENRKRSLQRKETTEAYRKTAQYQSPKNPMLEALENLLSGKTEKDLLHADGALRENSDLHESNVSTTYTVEPNDFRYIDGAEVTINAKEGAMPDETLKSQEFHVATPAISQMQQVRGEIATERYEELTKADEQEPYADLDVAVNIPERFLNDFANRDANDNTVFGQELESYLVQRTFTKATAKYSQQIAMVKNGYRPFDEPSFSRTA